MIGTRNWIKVPRIPIFKGAQRHFALWSVEHEKHHILPPASEIINPRQIEDILEKTKEAAKDPSVVADILQKAKDRAILKHVVRSDDLKSEFVQGLNLEEAAILLNVDSKNGNLMSELFESALDIKHQLYGNRVVLFAPLYIANYCVNSCTYCAFRHANKEMSRSALTKSQLIEEVESLEKMGHRRLLLLTGEHPKYTFDQFLDAVNTVASVRTDPCGNIRRINVEIPSLSISDFKRLNATDEIGTYTLFQETYHPETFRKVHPVGPKSNYDHRLLTMDRAQIGGIDDVGIGALFGLHDYRFEVLALMQHAMHLDKHYGCGPHTISIPRMQPAMNAPDALHPPAPVNDLDFMKLVAIIRCAVPYTGMILSTRESPKMRENLLNLGISQMSAASRTEVGAYHKGDPAGDSQDFVPTAEKHPGQFSLQDHRPLDEIVRSLMEMGYVPSWCTACYRLGRTGEKFMKIAKRGDIQNFCHPNALLTLQEYMEDYSSDETRAIGKKVIEKEQTDMSERSQKALKKKLDRILKGERDLYF